MSKKPKESWLRRPWKCSFLALEFKNWWFHIKSRKFEEILTSMKPKMSWVEEVEALLIGFGIQEWITFIYVSQVILKCSNRNKLLSETISALAVLSNIIENFRCGSEYFLIIFEAAGQTEKGMIYYNFTAKLVVCLRDLVTKILAAGSICSWVNFIRPCFFNVSLRIGFIGVWSSKTARYPHLENLKNRASKAD